jgi:hypothetical protein
MRGLGLKKLAEELEKTNSDVLLIAAPNYESRSMAFLEAFEPIFNLEGASSKFHIGLITLQAKIQQHMVLEKLKWYRNTQVKIGIKQLDERRFTSSHEIFSYPSDFSSFQLERVIKSWCGKLASTCRKMR